MTRIKITVLPEVAELTPDEMEAIFGAGKRPRSLGLECLEDRSMPAVATLDFVVQQPAKGFQASNLATGALPGGYTPSQIRTAYGINGITFGGIAGDGKGQTIAIIDATNDPNIAKDLDTFNQSLGLTSWGPPSTLSMGRPRRSCRFSIKRATSSVPPRTRLFPRTPPVTTTRKLLSMWNGPMPSPPVPKST